MENQLVTQQEKLMFDPQNITKETIKKFLCPLASDQELTLGIQIAKTFGLNPLKREVYFVKYKQDQPMQVLTGYEVYLKRAERSGKYAGLETTTEGSVQDGTLKAIVKIYRKDWDRPLIHEAYYDEYVQVKPIYKDGVKIGEEPNTFWKNKPKTMIKKVAESQGFRKAFPDEFDGMPYTADEVIDQEKIVDIKIETATPPASTKSVDPSLDTNEQKITSEQGQALLLLLNKNGWGMKDLSDMISFHFDLGKLSDICNKHLPQIKKYFSEPKSIKSPSEVSHANAN